MSRVVDADESIGPHEYRVKVGCGNCGYVVGSGGEGESRAQREEALRHLRLRGPWVRISRNQGAAMRRRFWVVYGLLLCLGMAFGQGGPVNAPAVKEAKAPELTQAEKDHLAILVSRMQYAQAEVREYMADQDAKHPGWKVQMSYDGVFAFVKEPNAAPPLPNPPGGKAAPK